MTLLISISYYNLFNKCKIKKINVIQHMCEKTYYIDKFFISKNNKIQLEKISKNHVTIITIIIL